MPVVPMPDYISHGGGLVTLYQNFHSLQEARQYQNHIKRLYVRAWSRLPASYIQAVLSFYGNCAALPSENCQLELF
jgi:hypothetical protein